MDDYKNPKEGKTYISPSLNAFGESKRKIRIASKAINSPDTYAFGTIKDEVVLRHTEDAQSYIAAKFIENNRGIFVLNIQGYSVATDKLPLWSGLRFCVEKGMVNIELVGKQQLL